MKQNKKNNGRFVISKKLSFHTLLLFVLLCISFAAYAQQIYYVDGPGGDGLYKGGKDSSNGTSLTNPLATITEANTRVSPGDLVLIRGGIYYEQIKPDTSGNADNKITYRGYNSELPQVRGNTGAGGGDPVKINNRSYIVVDGFNLYSSTKTWGAVVRFDGQHTVYYFIN